MTMSGTFYEQLGNITGLFDQWGVCERTVVACILARRVPWPGIKLVQHVIEAALKLQASAEESRYERDANDETLLANFLAPRTDDDHTDCADRVRQLLTLVPLMRPDNDRAKAVYVRGVPTLVQRCVDIPHCAAPALCRQLLSYLLVHPALTRHDHATLTQWLRYLENHFSGGRGESVWMQRLDVLSDNIWNSNSTFRRTIGKNIDFRSLIDDHTTGPESLKESFSKNGRDVVLNYDEEKVNFDAAILQPKSQRSNSLTPPSSNFLHLSSSAENLTDELFVKPRSFSLSSEYSLMRPIGSSQGTTGSETRLDDLRSSNFTAHPGMSNVGQWLKSLRLHKYCWLFSHLTYEEMTSVDDEYLEKLGITKGARHKLLLSIKKLEGRAAVLSNARSDLARLARAPTSSAPLSRALEGVRSVLMTPIPPTSDLPPAIVNVLELASKCLNERVDPARNVAASSDGNEPAIDPMALHCWLIEKALHHEAFVRPDLTEALKMLRHRLPPGLFYRHLGDLPRAAARLHPRWRTSWRGRGAVRGRRSWPPPARPAPPPARPKSHSYPRGAPDDYDERLDALCLQMTERAID